MWKNRKIIYAISIISGTTIGAGFFSLPYITSKVGWGLMLGYFLLLGVLVVIIHSFYGELALATPDYKRMPGFARIHLGRWAERIAFISTILGFFGTILAYLIIGGGFLKGLLSPILGGSDIVYVIIYLLLGSILIFLGRDTISKFTFGGMIFFFIILAFMFIKGIPHIQLSNLSFVPSGSLDMAKFFLPYGPILFSLWGTSLIPEAEEILGEDKKHLEKVIFISFLFPLIVYLVFIFLILGITGANTTESALTGLNKFLGEGITNLGLLFGLITTFTSFIALGLTLKKVFHYDLKLNKSLAWFITCIVPLILFLIGLNNFIPIISFIGGVMLGIDGILILLMYKKLKKDNIWIFPLILIFLLGIIYEVYYFIK